MEIHLVCGARPNFMKVAPLYHALAKERWASPVIVHTGQHYDANMSGALFDDLGLPAPHISLGAGSGTHAEQTAKVMVAYEKVLLRHRPDLVVVVGDVNSTLAASLVAAKLNIQTAHLEAGLRSFDRQMPEEINRIVTDALADILWAPSRDAIQNLRNEGIAPDKIFFVGNIMIDSLEMLRYKIERQHAYAGYGQAPRQYCVVTLHRPANVDDPAALRETCRVLRAISEQIPVIFPVHPRTRTRIVGHQILASLEDSSRLILPDPLGYVAFMSLVFDAAFVLTDSGGIQEETSYLGIPCLTLRDSTERPVTVTDGTNQLCGVADVEKKVEQILAGSLRRQCQIERWDGRTAQRIIKQLRTAHAHSYCAPATESDTEGDVPADSYSQVETRAGITTPEAKYLECPDASPRSARGSVQP